MALTAWKSSKHSWVQRRFRLFPYFGTIIHELSALFIGTRFLQIADCGCRREVGLVSQPLSNDAESGFAFQEAEKQPLFCFSWLSTFAPSLCLLLLRPPELHFELWLSVRSSTALCILKRLRANTYIFPLFFPLCRCLFSVHLWCICSRKKTALHLSLTFLHSFCAYATRREWKKSQTSFSAQHGLF